MRCFRSDTDGHGIVFSVGKSPMDGFAGFLATLSVEGLIKPGLGVEHVKVFRGEVFCHSTNSDGLYWVWNSDVPG